MLVFHVNFITKKNVFFFHFEMIIFLGRVPNDTTANITQPILPWKLINWYNNESWPILTSIYSNLNPTIVDQVCSTNDACRQDYIVRVNPVTGGATAAASVSFQQEIRILGRKFIQLFFFELFYLT